MSHAFDEKGARNSVMPSFHICEIRIVISLIFMERRQGDWTQNIGYKRGEHLGKGIRRGITDFKEKRLIGILRSAKQMMLLVGY